MNFIACLVVLFFCSSFIYSSNSEAGSKKGFLRLSIETFVQDVSSGYGAAHQVNRQMEQIENVLVYLEEKRQREVLRSHLDYHLRQFDKIGDDAKAAKEAIKKFVKPYQRTGNEKHIIDSQDFKKVYRLIYCKHALLANYNDKNSYWLWPSRLQKQDIPDCVNKCKDMIKTEMKNLDEFDCNSRLKLAQDGIIINQHVIYPVVVSTKRSKMK